ncbi:MAG: DUF3874 domain-containing protein [Bacteroidales bacterium]|nr:DUF3874 domain-containing protein [Candidatus Minthousia equi]
MSNISQQDETAMLLEYVEQHLAFRHNEISNVYEFKTLEQENFQPLTVEALNSILIKMKEDGLEIKSLKTNVEQYIYSDHSARFNPATDYLGNLPAWDGHDRISELFYRLPGMNTELQGYASKWFLSMVAHWMGMCQLHANELVLTLIGAQACGKSTFCASLLPLSLRKYYMDNINLGNKFDKEMALTNNLLVNIDELDQVRASRQAELKQTLSKFEVNGRPIFGSHQLVRPRFASFMATTNNRRPLNDPTGSRRFICIDIPEGMVIDNETAIEYDQLYAQALHELQVNNARYWQNAQETSRLMQLNHDYQKIGDVPEMVAASFRLPTEGEKCAELKVAEIVNHLQKVYPNLELNANLNVKVGVALKKLGIPSRNTKCGSLYQIVPLKAA